MLQPFACFRPLNSAGVCSVNVEACIPLGVQVRLPRVVAVDLSRAAVKLRTRKLEAASASNFAYPAW